jgi:hypothetical protein
MNNEKFLAKPSGKIEELKFLAEPSGEAERKFLANKERGCAY